MKVKGTYFQNSKEKPLVYGDVEIINPKRRRLRGETEKEGYCGILRYGQRVDAHGQ